MIRGICLKIWQKLPKIKYKFNNYIPQEFYNKNNPNIPFHYGIDGLPIGASGLKLIKLSYGEYHAQILHYNKWGNVKRTDIIHRS